MEIFPCHLEEFGQPLGVVGGHVVQHRCLGEAKLVGRKVGHHWPLEGVEEAGAEDPRPVQGGIGVGGPWADHRGLVLVGHLASRHGLLAGLRADDRKYLILRNQLGRRRRC